MLSGKRKEKREKERKPGAHRCNNKINNNTKIAKMGALKKTWKKKKKDKKKKSRFC